MNTKTMAVNIIGAGLAGLSAARAFAQEGVGVRLISFQPSERAQSNLAEGGINAALDVMGEQDTVQEHFLDTMKGGCDLADPNMVRNLTQAAVGLVKESRDRSSRETSADRRRSGPLMRKAVREKC